MKKILIVLAFVFSASCAGNPPPKVTPVPPTFATPEGFRIWWNSLTPEHKSFLYALDVALNQILPGLPGQAVQGMTISERAALEARKGNQTAIAICQVLDYYDKGHCEKAIAR